MKYLQYTEFWFAQRNAWQQSIPVFPIRICPTYKFQQNNKVAEISRRANMKAWPHKSVGMWRGRTRVRPFSLRSKASFVHIADVQEDTEGLLQMRQQTLSFFFTFSPQKNNLKKPFYCRKIATPNCLFILPETQASVHVWLSLPTVQGAPTLYYKA